MHINLNGTKIFFEVYGAKLDMSGKKLQEKPTFIFLHGGSFIDHTPYVNFWSRFADVSQVIFIDHRGCGRSNSNTKDDWNLKQWGQDVFDFCQALNIEKPIVGGMSFGGYVALSYLTQFPTHPAGIILTDTEANSSRERYLSRVRARLIEKGMDPNELVEIADKVFSNNFSLDLLGPYFNIIQMFGRPVTQIDNFAYTTTQSFELSQHFGEHEMFNFDFRDKLKNVNCPMLYLASDDAPLHTLENARELVAVYPKEKMQFEVFKNASSPTYDYDPIRAETLIRTFIKSLNQGA